MKKRQIIILVIIALVLFVADFGRTSAETNIRIEEHPSVVNNNKVDLHRYLTVSRSTRYGFKFNAFPVGFSRKNGIVQKWINEEHLGGDSVLYQTVQLVDFKQQSSRFLIFGKGECNAEATVNNVLKVNGAIVREASFGCEFGIRSKGSRKDFQKFVMKQINDHLQQYVFNLEELR